MKPAFPYIGGKRKLLKYLKPYFPKEYKRYFEPFLGGGAVLLDLCPTDAIVGDTNPDVINAFVTIRDKPLALIGILETLVNEEGEYYRLRGMDRSVLYEGVPDVFKAARFIALSKTSFGHRARYNRSGEINTSYGLRPYVHVYNRDDLIAINEYLNNNNILFINSDYRGLLLLAQEGDFAYIDPPYHEVSQDYFGDKWGEKEQIELKKTLDELTSRRVKWVESNNDTPFIRELYKDYYIHPIEITRSIATVNKTHPKVTELIITNFREGEDD